MIDLREGARRQHRAVALFAAIQCWLRGLDGVVFERESLERLLGLDRFKKTRISQMEEDFKEYFPFAIVIWKADKRDTDGNLNSFASFWVCKKEIKPFPGGRMSMQKRLAAMGADAPKLASFKIWQKTTAFEIGKASEAIRPFLADSINMDESLLTSYLLLLSHGQISPQSIPSFHAE